MGMALQNTETDPMNPSQMNDLEIYASRGTGGPVAEVRVRGTPRNGPATLKSS